MKPYSPKQLPLRHLNWKQLVPLVGEARAAVSRCDESLGDIPLSIFEILKWKESIASLRSQGISSSLKEVLRFALDGLSTEDRGARLQKILNAKEALDLAIRWPREKPLGISFLSRVHALVKKDSPNLGETGKFRRRQNWIGAQGCPIEEAYFYPPRASRLAVCMKNWIWYSRIKELDPIVQLAILIAQFLIIHPFMDGNGRVGRIYIPLYLFRKKLLRHPILFLSAYFEKHRLLYFQKLFAISEKGDWEGWILYFLQGIIEESAFLKEQTARLGELYQTVGKSDLFVHPVQAVRSDRCQEKKILIEDSKGLFWFEPLFEAVR